MPFMRKDSQPPPGGRSRTAPRSCAPHIVRTRRPPNRPPKANTCKPSSVTFTDELHDHEFSEWHRSRHGRVLNLNVRSCMHAMRQVPLCTGHSTSTSPAWSAPLTSRHEPRHPHALVDKQPRCRPADESVGAQLPGTGGTRGRWRRCRVRLSRGLWRAGACIVAQGVTYPLDTIRRRLEVSGSGLARQSYTSMWECFTSTVRREGLRALYGGCLANTVKIVPSAALQVRRWWLSPRRASHESCRCALTCMCHSHACAVSGVAHVRSLLRRLSTCGTGRSLPGTGGACAVPGQSSVRRFKDTFSLEPQCCRLLWAPCPRSAASSLRFMSRGGSLRWERMCA